MSQETVAERRTRLRQRIEDGGVLALEAHEELVADALGRMPPAAKVDADEEPHVFVMPFHDDPNTPEWDDSDDGCSREIEGSMVLYFYEEAAVYRMIRALIDSLPDSEWMNAVRIPCFIDLYRDRTTAPTALHGKPTHGLDGLGARELEEWEAWKKTIENEAP